MYYVILVIGQVIIYRNLSVFSFNASIFIKFYYFLLNRYFDTIRNISGNYENLNKYGNFFSPDESPRASIFRRDHVKVRDLDSMIKLMR